VASKLIQFVIKQFRVLGFKPLDKVIDGWWPLDFYFCTHEEWWQWWF
jgi:hypothetical protein